MLRDPRTLPTPSVVGREISRILLLAPLFLLAFVSILVTARPAVSAYDEGVILTGAMQVAGGLLPHRDFYANYGPAQFYILAALFKFFGPSILVERLWGAAVKALIVVVTYFLTRRLVSPSWSVIASLGSLVWLCFVENTIWPAWPALLATLLSIIAIFAAFDRRRPDVYLLLSGASVGAATLFRYDIGFLICVTESGVVMAFGLWKNTSWSRGGRKALQHLMMFGAGVCVVCVPIGLVFLNLGAAADFWFDMVLFPAHHYAATRSLPFPMLAPGAASPLGAECIVYFPLVVAATALAGVVVSDWTTHRVETEDWKVLLLLSVMLSLYAKGLVRVSPLHMALAIVPAFIGLVALLANHARSSRHVVSLLLGLTMLIAVLPTIDAFAAAEANAVVNIGGRWCGRGGLLPRLGCFDVENTQILATKYLQERTRPEDFIFVGLPRHDQIFINNVAFYFLAERRPATKWYHFDPGLQTTAAVQRNIIQDLETARPSYIVLDSEWDSVREDNASSSSSGVLLLDEFIQAHFQTVQVFGTFSVLRAKRKGSD